jgi:hypothetical protein
MLKVFYNPPEWHDKPDRQCCARFYPQVMRLNSLGALTCSWLGMALTE